MDQDKLDPQLRQLKQRMKQASLEKDRATLEQLIHEDYYLVDEQGLIIYRQQMIDSVVQANTNLSEILTRTPLNTKYQFTGDSIREVGEIELNGKEPDSAAQLAHDPGNTYIYTTIYVQGHADGLQVIAHTVTRKEEHVLPWMQQ